QELRCPKCQNQNIADSNAPISQDLRKLLHQQLQAGASDGEILDYMVARYGEFVRYRPRFGGVSLLLWAAPALLLLAGMVIMLLVLRSRKGTGKASAALGPDERARLDQLLEKAERES
ncbi:MAG: cytochrome c-type biogenesis protein CcmH, partial [Halioglobus sp.]|nr:cytochrome c-type biogenesis protein CcmH [Halioglobus sp.]